jgi:hypothetical protein
MIVFERRASAILYNLLRSRGDDRPFLIPANVCPIVPVTFLEAKQPFELVDIAESSLELDSDLVIAQLHARPRAHAGVLFVRPYGSERDPTSFFAELKSLQSDLLVIDDKCLCRPDWDGTSASPLADVTLFSTGPAKHVDLGGGGFAHLIDGVAYRSAPGGFRESALSAVTRRYERAIAKRSVFGGLVPGWLDLRKPAIPWEEHRRLLIEKTYPTDDHKEALNAIYSQELPRHIQLPRQFQSWRFNIRLPDPARFIASTFAAGLFASRHYATLNGVFGPGKFPAAERLHSEIVNLFNDQHFDKARAKRMVDLVQLELDVTSR